MITVLVVEDDGVKFGRVHSALIAAGVSEGHIVHASAAAQALTTLKSQHFDLMLLDVNLPRRLGEQPQRGGGAELLKETHRLSDDGGKNSIFRPHYIVGLTAYDDIIEEFGDSFGDLLWTIVRYVENSDHWIARIKSKIDYIRAAKASLNFSDGKTYGVDLGIICALEGVEFEAVRALPCAWQPLRLTADETRYLSGTISSNGSGISVIAAAAPQMGMPASAVLASKMIAQFRPRILAMVGICAGRVEKTNLGDIIVGNPSWDWGSGKIDVVGNQPRFRPAPHQVELDIDLSAELKAICSDVELLARVKHSSAGKKPPSELKVHFGPLASGAAVIANSEVFEGLLSQHRNLLGIEMEAYGVVMACKGSGKPRPAPIIMKSVCDFADRDKSDDYQAYAASVSANLLYHSVTKLSK